MSYEFSSVEQRLDIEVRGEVEDCHDFSSGYHDGQCILVRSILVSAELFFMGPVHMSRAYLKTCLSVARCLCLVTFLGPLGVMVVDQPCFSRF